MARDANAKIINYMNSKVPFINFTRGVFVSDDGDGYTHLNQTEHLIKRIQAGYPAVTGIRVHNDIFPWTGKDAKTARTVLSDALIKGVGLFCYVGHGTPDGFTGENCGHAPLPLRLTSSIRHWFTCPPATHMPSTTATMVLPRLCSSRKTAAA